MKGATLFGGGEGVGVGMVQTGIEHLWGIEYDADICAVACRNSFNSLCLDITQADPRAIVEAHGWPDILHASPPCPNFSSAKTDGEETELDIALADAACRFIQVIEPQIFTLENVWAYRNSESWQRITATLHALGYGVDFWHLNAANFGVPQTRKRMIAIALRSGQRQQHPTATHCKDPKPMFDTRLPWVGWYAAIEDLIPSLPESQFAPWQLARLPDEMSGIHQALLVDSAGYPDVDGVRVPVSRKESEPSNTIVGNHERRPMRALLVSQSGHGDDYGGGIPRDADEPSHTIKSNKQGLARAFLLTNQHSQPNGQGPPQIINGDDPSAPVTATIGGRLRAFVIDGKLSCSGERLQIVDSQEPFRTVVASASVMKDARASIRGRVVQMTPRALARFQSFPDWYELPEKNGLACRVIGNAVPPLMYKTIIEQVVRCDATISADAQAL